MLSDDCVHLKQYCRDPQYFIRQRYIGLNAVQLLWLHVRRLRCNHIVADMCKNDPYPCLFVFQRHSFLIGYYMFPMWLSCGNWCCWRVINTSYINTHDKSSSHVSYSFWRRLTCLKMLEKVEKVCIAIQYTYAQPKHLIVLKRANKEQQHILRGPVC